MSLAIKVENLSKAYQLGQFSTGTLSKDVHRWWMLMRGKEDPFLKIGETNDRTAKGSSDIVWSLKDINLEIEQGDTIGIIGRNGAGKSTLLKVLSQVTSPTSGNIKIKGRVASLLEVGTGFHPELSGRENIFLNGAILGMRKAEIHQKFDEIVDFAGVERYIDTPVKRYSSGMYVRLAFAVAAHLEQEILIVDEVLAVGDAEFQRKALGKMKDVSEGEGRTVLFVSHNMEAVANLTKRALLLQNGNVYYDSITADVISKYLSISKAKAGVYEKLPDGKEPEIVRVEVITSEGGSVHKNGEDMAILIDVNMPYKVTNMNLSLQIFNENEKAIVYAYAFDVEKPMLRRVGIQRYKFIFPSCKLYKDHYYLKLHLAESKSKTKFETLDKICFFEVKMNKLIEWGWPKDVCTYTEDFYWEEETYDSK